MDKPINTGIKFFGQQVRIDSTGILEVDKALKTLFYDDYTKSAPLERSRPDAKLVLAWMQKYKSLSIDFQL